MRTAPGIEAGAVLLAMPVAGKGSARALRPSSYRESDKKGAGLLRARPLRRIVARVESGAAIVPDGYDLRKGRRTGTVTGDPRTGAAFPTSARVAPERARGVEGHSAQDRTTVTANRAARRVSFQDPSERAAAARGSVLARPRTLTRQGEGDAGRSLVGRPVPSALRLRG